MNNQFSRAYFFRAPFFGSIKASVFTGFFIATCMLLTACQTPPHTQQLLNNPPNVLKHKIDKVPFYPQQEYFCGPTTLAEVANFYGGDYSPAKIGPNTFVPELKGTLQIEMKAATRQLGMLAYTQKASLEQLLKLIAEDIPVIVLQNNSIALLPQWHYAVVIGYDMNKQEIILHTGVTKNHRLALSTFERTWQRGEYWMLAMLPPDKTSDQLTAFTYTKACQALLDTGQTQAGITALKTATEQWPDNWLAYFLLANHYLAQHLAQQGTDSIQQALSWYEKGFTHAAKETTYLNNYAYALAQANCYSQAIEMINHALKLAPGNANMMDTKHQIYQDKQQAVLVQQCPQHNKFNE